MSQMGTGVAAGVAQTALQAQQAARRRDTDSTRDAAEAKRLRELLQSHMQALEEGEQAESPAQVHIDGQVPQSETQRRLTRDTQVKGQGPSPDAAGVGDHEPDRKQDLYRHVDVQA